MGITYNEFVSWFNTQKLREYFELNDDLERVILRHLRDNTKNEVAGNEKGLVLKNSAHEVIKQIPCILKSKKISAVSVSGSKMKVTQVSSGSSGGSGGGGSNNNNNNNNNNH